LSASPPNKVDDRIIKLRLVWVAAFLGLAGFVLEIGPVGGVFPRVSDALALQLPTLGFLAYLTLAASAAVGLHLGQREGGPPDDPDEAPPVPTPAEGKTDVPPARTPVRPEVHQGLMIITALGGYVVLKGASLLAMWPSLGAANLTVGQLWHAFRFGFFFILLAWLLLWQGLRWVATARRWVRLQAELLGVDTHQVVALVVVAVPAIWLVRLCLGQVLLPNVPLALAAGLHASVLLAALALWLARPARLRRTLWALAALGVLALALTVAQAIYEWVTPS
jgi:hypothetical protein